MKKIFFLLSVLVLCTTTAFSENVNLIAGGGSNLQLHNLTIQKDTTVFEIYLKTAAVDLFLDFTYGCFKISYIQSFGGQDMILTVDGVKDEAYSDTLTNQYKDFKSSYIGFNLAGKYPFKLGEHLYIFPMAGLNYYLNLTQTNGTVDERAAMSDQVKKEQNDISLLAGIGANIFVSKNFVIRIPVCFTYNLTPADSDIMSGIPDFTPSGYSVNAGIEAGYKLK